MPTAALVLLANRSLLRAWLLAAGYVVAFLLLDWASYIRPLEGLNITPWNPQPALATARGARHQAASTLPGRPPPACWFRARPAGAE